MNFINDHFLLVSAEADGCYMCDPHYSTRADIYDSVEKVINVFHDMMEKKIDNDYPIALYLIDDGDGEIMGDLELGIYAGCLSDLQEVSFKHNNMIYRVKRGNRKWVQATTYRYVIILSYMTQK